MKLKSKIYFPLFLTVLFAILSGCNDNQLLQEESIHSTSTYQDECTQAENPAPSTSIHQGQGITPTEDTAAHDATEEIYEATTEPTTSEEFVVPYVSLYCNLLDTSVTGYKNQTGADFFNIENPDEYYYIRPTDNTRYYYGTNDVVIGIRDNEICLYHTYESSSVRDIIKSIGAAALFEVTPAMQTVSNWYNTQNFFYWQIDNGYIGFITIGGDDPTECYKYIALSLYYFEDLNDINVVSDDTIEIMLAPDDYDQYPDEYLVYSSEDTEYGDIVMLTPNTEISDFKFFILDREKLIIDDELVISEVLFTSDSLTPDKPFVTRIYQPGYFGPSYGISYNDASGIQHTFAIYVSGEDGSFSLKPF